MPDYEDTHGLDNDKDHVTHHTQDMERHLIEMRAIPLIVIYQLEDGSFGVLSGMLESDTIEVLQSSIKTVKDRFDDAVGWQIPYGG